MSSAGPPQALPGRHFQDGVSQSGGERNHLFMSRGGVQFSDVSPLSGLDSPADGRAFALLDWDRDGWLDVAAVNANAPLLELFHNEIGALPGAKRHVIAVELEGGNHAAAPAAGLSNRDGVGARIAVELPDATLLRERQAGEGLAAQNSSRLLIGIGAHTRAAAVEVRWPSGRRQRVEDVAAGSLLRFQEDVAEVDLGEYRRALPVPESPAPERPILAIGRAAPVAADAASSGPPRARPALQVFTTLATWCEICVRELPQVSLLRAVFGEHQVGLHGLAVDDTDTPAKLAAWRARHQPAYTIAEGWPPGALDEARRWLEQTLRREGLPASIVTDGDGRVLTTLWGVPTISDLRALLPPG